jgi:hypothetical protein
MCAASGSESTAKKQGASFNIFFKKKHFLDQLIFLTLEIKLSLEKLILSYLFAKFFRRY